MFTILREVEKEVVLVDSAVEAPPEDPSAMQIDTGFVEQVDMAALFGEAPMISGQLVGVVSELSQSSDSRVLKVIKKQEVEILCTQHNPVRIFHCYVNRYSYPRISDHRCR